MKRRATPILDQAARIALIVLLRERNRLVTSEELAVLCGVTFDTIHQDLEHVLAVETKLDRLLRITSKENSLTNCDRAPKSLRFGALAVQPSK